jgi:very-short-patch-repair endonuclease
MPYSDPEIDLLPIGTLVASYVQTLLADSKRAEEYGDAQVSPAEVELCSRLKQMQIIGWEQQVQIGPYFADFVFGGVVVVEIDGRAYHQDIEKERRRDAYLLDRGMKEVLHIRALDVFANPKNCIERIMQTVRHFDAQ